MFYIIYKNQYVVFAICGKEKGFCSQRCGMFEQTKNSWINKIGIEASYGRVALKLILS